MKTSLRITGMALTLLLLFSCAKSSPNGDTVVKRHILEKNGAKIELSYPGAPLPYGADIVVDVKAEIPAHTLFSIPAFDPGRSDLILDGISIEPEDAGGFRQGSVVLVPYKEGTYTVSNLIFVLTNTENGDITNLTAPALTVTVEAPALNITSGEDKPAYEPFRMLGKPSKVFLVSALIAAGLIIAAVLFALISAVMRKKIGRGKNRPDAAALLALKCAQYERSYFLPGAEGESSIPIRERARHLFDIVAWYVSEIMKTDAGDIDPRIESIRDTLLGLSYGKEQKTASADEKTLRDLYRDFRTAALPQQGGIVMREEPAT